MKKLIDIPSIFTLSNNQVFTIAEIGINHGGSFDLCAKMIEAAAISGADSVKLQIVNPKSSYVEGTTSYKEFSNKVLSEEELLKKHRREMLQRIRCIALDAMGKNILSDPKQLQPRDKRDFVKRVEELYILSEDEIKNMFNNICHDTIFQNGTDYSTFVVQDC